MINFTKEAENILITNKTMVEITAKKFEEDLKEKHPALKKMYCLKNNITMDIVKEKNKDIIKNHVIVKLETELKKINNSILKFYKDNNIDENKLIPGYYCNICMDTGSINEKKCNCIKQIKNNLLMKHSNICFSSVPTLNEYPLDIYFSDEKKSMKKIVHKFIDFVNFLPQKKYNQIILSGKVGGGKSYLSKSILKSCIEKGMTCYMINSFSLGKNMLDYHTTFDGSKKNILENILYSEVLVIDDFGTEPMYNNVTINYLLSILNERVSKNFVTIINTNLDARHILDKYGERIFSRIFDKSNSIKINMNFKDLRLEKKQVN